MLSQTRWVFLCRPFDEIQKWILILFRFPNPGEPAVFPTRRNNGDENASQAASQRRAGASGIPLVTCSRRRFISLGAKPVRTKPRKSGWITTAIFSSLSCVSAAEAAAAAKPAKLETLDHRVWNLVVREVVEREEAVVVLLLLLQS